jgi:hypothetical protein
MRRSVNCCINTIRKMDSKRPELLFEALNQPDGAKKIAELYSFKPNDFIALTAKKDVFSVEAKEKEQVLVEILNSNTWKLALFIRKIRIWMFPSDSYGEYLVKKIFFRNKK